MGSRTCKVVLAQQLTVHGQRLGMLWDSDAWKRRGKQYFIHFQALAGLMLVHGLMAQQCNLGMGR